MNKRKGWKCSECGFPASDAGIVRSHLMRQHHGFGTIKYNDTEVTDTITEYQDTNARAVKNVTREDISNG